MLISQECRDHRDAHNLTLKKTLNVDTRKLRHVHYTWKTYKMLILHPQPTSTTVKCWFHKNAWPQRYSFGLRQSKLPSHLPHSTVPTQCFNQVKVDFEKKVCSSHWEISVSSTSQKYDNVTTPYYRYTFFLLHNLSDKWHSRRLKTKENWLYFEVIIR